MRNSPPNSRDEALGRGPWAQGWRVRESDPPSDEVELGDTALGMVTGRKLPCH